MTDEVVECERWVAIAQAIGANTLVLNEAKDLSEKVFFRLIRDVAVERLVALGGCSPFLPDESVLELETAGGLPRVRFREDDIEMMRGVVDEYLAMGRDRDGSGDQPDSVVDGEAGDAVPAVDRSVATAGEWAEHIRDWLGENVQVRLFKKETEDLAKYIEHFAAMSSGKAFARGVMHGSGVHVEGLAASYTSAVEATGAGGRDTAMSEADSSRATAGGAAKSLPFPTNEGVRGVPDGLHAACDGATPSLPIPLDMAESRALAHGEGVRAVWDSYMNHIVCPECFEKHPCEEKCCTHGCAVGIACIFCGAIRKEGEPSWACGGGATSAEIKGYASVRP